MHALTCTHSHKHNVLFSTFLRLSNLCDINVMWKCFFQFDKCLSSFYFPNESKFKSISPRCIDRLLICASSIESQVRLLSSFSSYIFVVGHWLVLHNIWISHAFLSNFLLRVNFNKFAFVIFVCVCIFFFLIFSFMQFFRFSFSCSLLLLRFEPSTIT